MKARLISPGTSKSDWEILLDHFPVVIGRSLDAEIQPIDPMVSELHCEIDEVAGQLFVRDLGSERGTFVNGELVNVAPLLPGDELTVAESRFVASYEVDKSPDIDRDGIFDDECRSGDYDNSELRNVTTFLDLYNLIEKQRRGYLERHGKDLPPDDPMFPDPPHPEHLEHMFVEEMRQVGEDPAVIYAFETTGLLVTEFNQDQLTDAELARWEAAIDEYEKRCEWSDEQPEFPIGAVVLKGPDKTTTTMVTATVVFGEEGDPVERRWVGSGVSSDPRVTAEIRQFFAARRVKSVIMVKENVSCPHDEGLDYPPGEDCPFCPYWKGKQGTG